METDSGHHEARDHATRQQSEIYREYLPKP